MSARRNRNEHTRNFHFKNVTDSISSWRAREHNNKRYFMIMMRQNWFFFFLKNRAAV